MDMRPHGRRSYSTGAIARERQERQALDSGNLNGRPFSISPLSGDRVPSQRAEMPIREPSNSMIVDPEAKLRQIFETVDVNRDGNINKREMIKFCRSSPDVAALLGFPEGLRQEDGSRDILEMRFQAIDRDDDREVTWEEFRDFFMAEMAQDRYSVQHP
eukprot:symbB.v1.2.035275.t1/scaffold4709.1/size36042/4